MHADRETRGTVVFGFGLVAREAIKARKIDMVKLRETVVAFH